MDNIIINNQNGHKSVTIIIEREMLSNLELLREAAKVLQREVLRYETNSNWNFNR